MTRCLPRIAVPLLWLAGCWEVTVEVPVRVAADGTAYEHLLYEALEGSCPSASAIPSHAALGEAPLLTDEHASLAVWGIRSDCTVVAFGCAPLEGDDPIEVPLTAVAEPFDRCPGRICANGACGTSADAGPAIEDMGPARECSDPADCDDGVDCTTDQCSEGVCRNEPDDSVCPPSGSTCVDAFCDPSVGCGSRPAVSGPCDDGFFCNGPERCERGLCTNLGEEPCAAGGVCDEDRDECG